MTTIAGGGTTLPGGTSTTTPVRKAAEVRVKVYNASGVQGTAQTLTDKLQRAGLQHADARQPEWQHAHRHGRRVRPRLPAEGTLLALFGIGNGATVEPYPKDPPPGASDADCIVTIGTA